MSYCFFIRHHVTRQHSRVHLSIRPFQSVCWCSQWYYWNAPPHFLALFVGENFRRLRSRLFSIFVCLSFYFVCTSPLVCFSMRDGQLCWRRLRTVLIYRRFFLLYCQFVLKFLSQSVGVLLVCGSSFLEPTTNWSISLQYILSGVQTCILLLLECIPELHFTIHGNSSQQWKGVSVILGSRRLLLKLRSFDACLHECCWLCWLMQFVCLFVSLDRHLYLSSSFGQWSNLGSRLEGKAGKYPHNSTRWFFCRNICFQKVGPSSKLLTKWTFVSFSCKQVK